MISLIRHELRVRRGTILGWAIGLSFFGSVYIVVYTLLPAEMKSLPVQSVAFLKSLGMKTLATFDGFVLSTTFNFLPLLVGALGIALGIGALASEEENGTLELQVTLPISRTRLLLAKAIALAVAALIVLAAAGTVVMGVFTVLDIETTVTAPDLFAVVLSHWLIAFDFMMFSLFAGAFTPSRATALNAASTALVVTFFGENLAGMAPALETYRPLSPFSYFARIAEMLTGDVAWTDMAVLALGGLGFLVLAILSFQRRNITVGAWPWQRPRMPRAS